MSVDTKNGSTRAWSCATLTDGIDHLMSETNKVEEQEKELMKLMQDRFLNQVPCNSVTRRDYSLIGTVPRIFRQDMEKTIKAAQSTRDQPAEATCLLRKNQFSILNVRFVSRY